MADDKTVKIGIQTTADTSGLEKADSAVNKLNGTVNVSTVDGFLDKTADKARVAEFAFYDLEKEIARTGNSGEKLAPLTAAITRVDNAAKGGGAGINNLGGLAQQAGYQITDFAVQVQGGQSAITAFSQQFPQLIGSFTQAGVSIKSLSAGFLRLPIDMGTAISLSAVAIGIGSQLVVGAYTKMRAAQDGYSDAVRRATEEEVFRREQQRKLDAETRDQSREGFFKRENDQLERQLRLLRSISETRSALGSLEVEAARQEVDSAKLRGGDVALAEANALAAELKTGLEKLQQPLADASQAVNSAQQQATLANFTYQQAISEQLPPDKIAELGTALDTAKQAVEDARRAVVDQESIFTAAKTNLLRGTENRLATLEEEFNDATSTTARKAFDGVYNSLKTALADGPSAAITAIKPSIQPITDAAAAKAGEVNKNLSQAATAVSDTGEKMATAVDQFGKSIAARDERFLTLMASLLPLSENLVNRLTQYEQRVASLEQRLTQ